VYHAKIVVTLRRSILDPQGKAVEHGIHTLGHAAVENVRIGKMVEMHIDVASKDEAERIAADAAGKLLANPVMEDFHVTVEKVG
jgi:phosphoribosylformylglycinamidine synthase